MANASAIGIQIRLKVLPYIPFKVAKTFTNDYYFPSHWRSAIKNYLEYALNVNEKKPGFEFANPGLL